MGRSPRPKPHDLAQKLLQIRRYLALSQSEMVKHLNYTEGYISAPHISEFENGKREPSLLLLLRYARTAKVSVEMLIDDELDLPDGF